jgi:hypothetical protein
MYRFFLEIYFESDDDRSVADRGAESVRRLVTTLAPHIELQIVVIKYSRICRRHFDWGGADRDVPCHEPSSKGRQTLLITNESLGAEGWGWPGAGVASKQEMEAKAHAGGDVADILLHEWLHTIQNVPINGRPVPFADDAEKMGFKSVPGLDGKPTWHDWFRFALGGPLS